MNILKVGIIGAGRMGRIRALSADRHPRCEVVALADTDVRQAQSFAEHLGCTASQDWREVTARADVDAVVVATPPKYLAEISTAALAAGKHVFCEKPGARNAAEMEGVLRCLYGAWPPVESSGENSVRRKDAPQMVMGFTLRHHPAVVRARRMLMDGEIGRPMYVLGRYGHGGRPGYAREWRGQPDLAGGGELIDQGVHLIDLSRWFLGEFEEVTGFVGTYFWRPDLLTPGNALEDNAFLLLRSAESRVASLQASWTQWKNHFGFEIYGEEGFLRIQGLGGNYGEEELVLGRRKSDGEAPELKQIALSRDLEADVKTDVWTTEWQAFVSVVRGEKVRWGGQPAMAVDAWQSLRIVDAAYASSGAPATVLSSLPNVTPRKLVRKAAATAGSIQEKNDSL